MKISARNVIDVRVTDVKDGAVNAEIDMEMSGGQKLASIISLDSAKELQLADGVKALAIIKASNIMISENSGKISARNAIPCTISKVISGAVNAQVELMAGQQILISMITMDSSESLELTPGKEVYAIIKASDIMIGLG